MSTFEPLGNIRPHLLREGITGRAVNGERMTMAVIDLEPDIVMPEHRHENEQLGFVITGTMMMRVGSEKRELKAGDTYTIPSNVPHDVVAGPQGCTVADVFAPLRADWAALKRGEATPGQWP